MVLLSLGKKVHPWILYNPQRRPYASYVEHQILYTTRLRHLVSSQFFLARKYPRMPIDFLGHSFDPQLLRI
jgi:hypothetical protein